VGVCVGVGERVWVATSDSVCARVGAHTSNCQRRCQMLLTRSPETYLTHAAGGCRVAFYFLHLQLPLECVLRVAHFSFSKTLREVRSTLSPALSTRSRIHYRNPPHCSIYTYTTAGWW